MLVLDSVALHIGKVKRASHPLRNAAVRLMMRGEATPAEIRQVLQVSRQLIYYWCRAAGIAGKLKQARKAYIMRSLLKGIRDEDRGKPTAVTMLRARLRAPRPSAEQLRDAHRAKVDRDAPHP